MTDKTTPESFDAMALRIWAECVPTQPLFNAQVLEYGRRLCDELAKGAEPIAWVVWIEVADNKDFDSIWSRPEFANDHLNEMLQTDWGEPITASGVFAMFPVENDHYPIPEWLRTIVQNRLKEQNRAHPSPPAEPLIERVSVPREPPDSKKSPHTQNAEPA